MALLVIEVVRDIDIICCLIDQGRLKLSMTCKNNFLYLFLLLAYTNYFFPFFIRQQGMLAIYNGKYQADFYTKEYIFLNLKIFYALFYAQILHVEKSTHVSKNHI